MGLRRGTDSGGIEDVGFDFAFVTAGRNFFIVHNKADACGVTDSYDDFARGADGGVRGRDQSFVGDGLAVGGNGDPAGFLGSDQDGEGGEWFGRGRWGAGVSYERIRRWVRGGLRNGSSD